MFFCRHDWEVKDKTVLLSAYEQKMSIIAALAAGTGGVKRIGGEETPNWAFRKKVIITMACKKCGKLKVIREENP